MAALRDGEAVVKPLIDSPELQRLVDELVRQNGVILASNLRLLEMLTSPMVVTSALADLAELADKPQANAPS